MNNPDPIAYKVLTGTQLDELLTNESFTGAPVDIADGFIHLSSAGQLDETVGKHFAGQMDLAVAAVDLLQLGESVRWEVSRGGALFPHIYAVLPLAAVIAYGPLTYDERGKVVLPDAG